jgi:hypothetical protein
MTSPTITLAGQPYPIPMLAIAQIREIDWRIIRSGSALADRTKLTQQARDDFYDIVYAAVTKATPMTREAFDGLGATLIDVMNAMPTIINQTNLFKPAAEATPPTGEAPSTGTES